MTPQQILQRPRERHYMLGHEAFRQLCEHDPHQFFERMVSDKGPQLIAELVRQVEINCQDDSTVLDPLAIKVVPTSAANHPLLIIQMPPVMAFAECIYVGIVLAVDITNPLAIEHPKIHYFTLEMGEEKDQTCRLFCQWQGDTHYNLAEMDNQCSLQDFILVIQQRLGK